MKICSINWLLALVGGLLLALMIKCNSLMAKYTTPIFASWVAHGIGAVVAFLFVILWSQLFYAPKFQYQPVRRSLWLYFGGIPGALTVVLSAITVNSKIGFSGTLALMLVGQIIFGLCADVWGLFGIPKRSFILNDVLVIFLVAVGSILIILFRV